MQNFPGGKELNTNPLTHRQMRENFLLRTADNVIYIGHKQLLAF